MHLLNVRHLNPVYDDPEICERCGAPIANVYEVEDGNGEIHIYGSKCIRAILPKSRQWFELYVTALNLGIVDFFGREAATAFTVKDLSELIEFSMKED